MKPRSPHKGKTKACVFHNFCIYVYGQAGAFCAYCGKQNHRSPR